MTLIKLNKIALGLIALSSVSTSFAASMAPAAADQMQFGASIMYVNDFKSMALGLDAQNSDFEAGVMFDGERYKTASNLKYGAYDVGGYAGKRIALKSNIFGSVGLAGNYTILSGSYKAAGVNFNNYVVGAYLGLEYQPSNNIQIFARIMAADYNSTSSNTKEWSALHDGQVGIKYFM